MRLDKFLKVSRLVKRRTVANELCDAGGVLINGKTAKAAHEVKVGDALTITLGRFVRTVKVVDVPVKNVPAQLADSLYTVLSETYHEPSSHFDSV